MKKRQRNKPRPSNIGRRTGVDVVQGKKIRRQDDGTDVFDDYWTDNDSIDSNQTTQSSPDKTTSDKILENVPILIRDSVSYRNAPRSSMKKTLNQRSGEYEDHTGYFRPEHLKRSEVTRRKLHFSEEIGRRTGVDVVQGKKIRRQDDGTDVYEDYWTDSDLIDSNQTIQSMHSPVKTRSEGISENVSVFDRDSVSFMKTRNQGSGKFEDRDGYSSPEQSKRSEVSRKKSHFFEDVENSAIARSKMTQTSHLLDETESTPSKNRMHMHQKSWKSNRADLSDSKINSSARKSPRMSSNSSQTPNRRESLPSSRDDTKAARVSLSSKMESGKKAKDKRNSRVMSRTSHSLDGTKGSSFRNRTYTHKTSYSKEVGKNKTDSSDSERSSPVKTSSVLSETSHEPNRREDLPSSRDDIRAARVSSSSKMEYGIKTKEMRDLSVMTQTSHPLDATEDSPFKNRTYMPKRSYPKDTVESKAGSPDSERNSPVEKSVLSEISHVSNRREYLSSSRDDTRAARVSLSSKIESEKKAKDKRNSRVMTRTSHPLDRTEGSPFRNRTYTPKTSYSKETGKNKADSSDSERNSPVETSRVLSETLHVSNRREYLPSSRDDTRAARVSLSSKMESEKKAKDKKNSRVMTRNSHPLNGTEGSPVKNMSDPCDNERNFSVERHSGVSSKTPSSPNSKKEVNKRNSSLRRPPQYAAKSSEVLNQKENIPSRNRRSVNKTEMSVSGQRENELQEENKRKSSMVRSPIAIKRKMMQTPDALENSPSKTSCVQNGWEEENEKNFSGRKSHHRTAKSPEVLNRKRNISSKSVNRSGILVSCQKENDQGENNQKSPRASESSTIETSDLLENRQVSSTADSPMKTASQDALQENASSPCKGLRRSSRYKRPPLASWRNERLKFVKASAEKEYECVGVEEGQPEDNFAFRILKRRLESKVQKRKIVAWKKRKNIPKHIKKTPIINEKTEKIIELYLHRPFSSYEWTLPPNEDNPGYVISRTFKSRFMTFGFLDIAGHSMKDRQHSPQDNLHFVVVSGVVEAVINATSFTFEKGDSFIVPVGTFYSISNETSKKALLCFTSFRIPFFSYQERD